MVLARMTLVGLLLCCAGLGCRRNAQSTDTPPDPGPQPSGPNVVLISIDTLRPDHLHCYGYRRDTSPTIDRLATEGVLFENHISSTSWTLPAHAALFTSVVDSVHGCLSRDQGLPDNLETLAERFAAAGYATAGFFSCGWLHPATGLGQGFQHYEDCRLSSGPEGKHPDTAKTTNGKVTRSVAADITNPTVYQAVSKWLAAHQNRKFFLFIHFYDVHYDFVPPPPYNTRFDPDYTGSVTGRKFLFDKDINADMPARDLQHIVALYDGEIAWTDFHVAKILADLKQAGLYDETVIALTSDHGTEFFDHGGKGHRTTLYDELIRIPLIIRYPAGLPAGVRVSSQTHIIDIGPTLLALARLPASRNVMGHSLVSLMTKQGRFIETPAISELFSMGRDMRSLRTRRWKYIDDRRDNLKYFFDLTNDPREQHRLQTWNTKSGRETRTSYDQALAMIKAHAANPPTADASRSLPDDVVEQLKTLGYVGD